MSSSQYLRFFILYITIFSSFYLTATATSIKLEISDDGQGRAGGETVFLDMPFEVTVSVSDGDRDTGNIELVGTDQVKVVSSSRSTNISMVNGKFTSQTSYIYQLYAHKEGKLKLGPARLKQGNQTIESNVLDITAIKSTEQQAQTAVNANQQETVQQAAVICRLTANKKTIVVGQPVVVKVTVLSRGQIAQVAMEPPKFPGFIVKEIQKDTQRQENFNNILHNVIEKRYVLIPSEPGQKNIEPIKIAYAVPVRNHQRNNGLFEDAFFSGFFGQERIEQKTTVSNALSITVDPFPDNQGHIDGVGEFTAFNASLDKSEAHVNEALKLKLELVGIGNFDQIPTPKLILPSFIKAYESKSNIKEDLTTEYTGGKKSFEYVIQIDQDGDAQIPSQQFAYFDTSTKTVKVLQTPVLSVHLTHGSQVQLPKISSTVPVQEQDDIVRTTNKVNKQDISFIQEDGPITNRSGHGTGINLFIFFIIMVFILFGIFGRRRFLPSFFNGKNHKKQIEKLHQEFNVLCSKNQGDKLYQFFVKFLAKTTDTNIEMITHEWLQEYLVKKQWSEERINEFFDFLNECAGCNFVSQSVCKENNFAQLFKRASHWLLLLRN